jgi:hypothetical protein
VAVLVLLLTVWLLLVQHLPPQQQGNQQSQG